MRLISVKFCRYSVMDFPIRSFSWGLDPSGPQVCPGVPWGAQVYIALQCAENEKTCKRLMLIAVQKAVL